MKKQNTLFSLLFVALLAVAPGGYSQQAAPGLMPPLSPDVQAILSKQMSRNAPQQKTTAAELLLAVVSVKNPANPTQYDSTRFYYSGNRGSNLTGSVWTSYSSFFEPSSVIYYGPLVPARPTLLFDSMRRFSFTPGTGVSLYTKAWEHRSYDANNNTTAKWQKQFNTNGTVSLHAYDSVTYDNSNLILTSAYFEDTTTNYSGGMKKIRSIKAVNAGGFRTSDTSMSTNSQGRAVNLYTYSSAGLPTSATLMMLNPSTGAWQNYIRSVMSYDASNRLITHKRHRWDGTQWSITWMDSFGYTGNADQFTYMLQYIPGGGSTGMLIDTNIQHITLNSSGLIDSSYQYSNTRDTSRQLRLTGKSHALYNANDHIKSVFNVEVLTNINTVSTYYYGIPTAVITPLQETSARFAALHPNPAGAAVSVSLQNATGAARISVINMAGQLLYEMNSPAQESMTLPTEMLATGVYIVQVEMDGRMEHLRMVKK